MNNCYTTSVRPFYFAVVIVLCLCCSYGNVRAQQDNKAGALIIRFSSSYTSFPDDKRLNGHTHDSLFYDAAAHYRDSSVMLLIPERFKAIGKKVDIVFWFHGWHNNIDTALQYYHLASQFVQAKRNAVLVLAESAKNAADSYGGKLEKDSVFLWLLNDVLNHLKQHNIIPAKGRAGNILLAGHSGAYRVIAYMLQNGCVDVKQVLLFDALYSETDKYIAWIKRDAKHEFTHLFTNRGGGTDEVSFNMMADLKKQDIPFSLFEEQALNASLLREQRINFIHSIREHNDIINEPDNFRFFIENCSFLKKTR